MKSFKFILILSLLGALISCQKKASEDLGGDSVTGAFLNQYSGSYSEVVADKKLPSEKINIQRDGTIVVTRLRDVGTPGDSAIPTGTICSYVLTGQIRNVIQADDAHRTKMDPKTRQTYVEPATHKLSFNVTDAVLTDALEESSSETPGCQLYLAKVKQKLPSFTYGMELFGPGNIRLHTKDNDSYRGGEKTDLVLDEVYVRQ